ncbi:MAG: hypothetical protein Q7S40_14605 [Opitutaceae bacterium]|nr:hypothetical protein [Opitutaceae bacterium]
METALAAAGQLPDRDAHWRKALNATLAGVPVSARTDERKSAPWKVAVAAHLKATTDVPNGWLAERLKMGSATRVSQVVGAVARQPTSPSAEIFNPLSERLAT